jgi:hypothetical protein
VNGAPPLPEARLRVIDHGDSGFLYRLAGEHPQSWPRLCQKGVPNPGVFEGLLWDGVLAQYLVEVRADGRDVPIGTVCLYDADHIGGTVWIESVGLPGDHHEAVRGDALGQLLERAFTAWPFRRVYAVHHSCDPPVFGALPQLGAAEEVRLRDAYRHDGLLWDRVISAVSREDWAAAS